jgi:hypothetical protein
MKTPDGIVYQTPVAAMDPPTNTIAMSVDQHTDTENNISTSISDESESDTENELSI